MKLKIFDKKYLKEHKQDIKDKSAYATINLGGVLGYVADIYINAKNGIYHPSIGLAGGVIGMCIGGGFSHKVADNVGNLIDWYVGSIQTTKEKTLYEKYLEADMNAGGCTTTIWYDSTKGKILGFGSANMWRGGDNSTSYLLPTGFKSVETLEVCDPNIILNSELRRALEELYESRKEWKINKEKEGNKSD